MVNTLPSLDLTHHSDFDALASSPSAATVPSSPVVPESLDGKPFTNPARAEKNIFNNSGSIRSIRFGGMVFYHALFILVTAHLDRRVTAANVEWRRQVVVVTKPTKQISVF
ncbi:hypothetical protein glysoja_004361 [Glycine soja]|nr:hypothetical protein glysoja_004361 [Glycine soja]